MSSMFGGGGSSFVPGTGDPSNGLTVPDNAQISEVEQPINVRLAPEQPLHGKIVQKLRARLDLSYRNMSLRYPEWDRVDEHLRMYTDLSRPVRKGDGTLDMAKRENPFDRAIVVPMSYAIHEVRKTQLFGLFAHREPFIQVSGRGPEDEKPAELMEAVLDYDFSQSRGAVSVMSMIQDADRYGTGVIYDHWEDQSGWMTVRPQPSPLQAVGIKLGIIPPPGPQQQWGTIREFNRWTSVDPFNVWPDPRVTMSNLQEGEFFGHRVMSGLLSLMERSIDKGGPYFNLDKLKTSSASGSQGETSRLVGRTRFAIDQFALREMGDEKDKGFYVLDHLQVKLIPKDWELGEGTVPEIWWFTLADERTIIRAHKSAYAHNQFCYSVAETNPDPHTIANPGVIENLDGLQRVMNWLLNSHLENVRKFINNELIFDPLLLEEADVMNPGAARWIRLTQAGSDMLRSGVPIDSMYSQLKVADVTGSHLEMVQGLFDMGQRLSGASDPMMGAPTTEQKTLGEVQAIISGASQRLGVTAKMMDAQAIAPLAERAIANRQQFTSLDQYFRIAGDLAKEHNGRALQQIGVEDIQGNFDYVPHSGVAGGDPARLAQTWQNILQTVMQFGAVPGIGTPDPTDGKKLDIREILNETIRNLGVRDIEEYYQVDPQWIQQQQMMAQQAAMGMQQGAPIQVVPDAQVQQQVQQGNYVPTQ